MTKIQKRHFEDVKVGDALPNLEIPVTLTSLVMYAGATWDFHRYHYDAEFVKKNGIDAPFMDGQMLGAFITRLLMQWGGADAFLRKLSYHQKAIIFVGDTITISGHVEAKDADKNATCIHCILSVSSEKAGLVADGIAATLELSRKSN